MRKTRKCAFCGKEFTCNSGSQRYCSEHCAEAAKAQRKKRQQDFLKAVQPVIDIANIDNVLKDAHTKLKVSVNVADADWQKIQDLFDQEHKWMLAKMQEHIREVNGMFVEERRRVQKRYKEYDGCYLGHYAQWFFFTIGFSVVAGGLAILISRYYSL